MLTDTTLAAAAGCTADRAASWRSALERAMTRCSITTPRRAAHFLAQVGHESGGLTRTTENLNYSAQRLREVWPSRFNQQQAADYAGQPQRIANRVYAGRMGNGGESTGDGWRYRGRSPIQLTGRTNYAELAGLTGLPLVSNPDIAAEIEEGALIAACWWQTNGLNRLADTGDVLAVSRRINLGTTRTNRIPNGLQDRIARTRRAEAALGAA